MTLIEFYGSLCELKDKYRFAIMPDGCIRAFDNEYRYCPLTAVAYEFENIRPTDFLGGLVSDVDEIAIMSAADNIPTWRASPSVFNSIRANLLDSLDLKVA